MPASNKKSNPIKKMYLFITTPKVIDEELEGYDDIDKLPVHDETVENDKAVNIVRNFKKRQKILSRTRFSQST